jgi:uroporphyrinogen decarboxylase
VDSRERTFLCLNHEEPDRVPIDFWASRGTRQKIRERWGESFEEFLERADVDLRYIEGPRYMGPVLEGPAGAHDVDIWGVPRVLVKAKVDDGTGQFEEPYREVLASPLARYRSIEELLAYARWPSPDWFDYSGIRAQCTRYRDSGRVVVFMGDRLNRIAQLKPAMYLRGTERIFLDLVEAPEIARALFTKISGFYLEYARRILEAARGGIDILCTGDDFGAQNALLVSPLMWRDFLREGFAAYAALGHAYDARVMHHSCGSVHALIPELIRAGLDILQALQPEAALMEPERLKRAFGDRLSFQGGVSIQQVLPHGRAAEVRAHVRRLFEAMAPGGGFIACSSHNIQADTPLANIEALLSAYRDFGVYARG